MRSIGPFAPVSTLNEALLRVIRNKFPKRTIVARTRGISLGLMTSVAWLTVQSRGHIECGVVVGSRRIGKSIEWLVIMFCVCAWKLNEHSMSGA